jgi:hypothetical protein
MRRLAVLRIGGFLAQHISKCLRTGITVSTSYCAPRLIPGGTPPLPGQLFDSPAHRLDRAHAAEKPQGRRYLRHLGQSRRRQRLGYIDPIDVFGANLADQGKKWQKIGDQSLTDRDLQRSQLVHRGRLENQRLDVFRLDRGFCLIRIQKQRFLRKLGLDRCQIGATKGSPEIGIDWPIVELVPYQIGSHGSGQAAIEELQLRFDRIRILLARTISAQAGQVGCEKLFPVVMAEIPYPRLLGAACRTQGRVVAREAPRLWHTDFIQLQQQIKPLGRLEAVVPSKRLDPADCFFDRTQSIAAGDLGKDALDLARVRQRV